MVDAAVILAQGFELRDVRVVIQIAVATVGPPRAVQGRVSAIVESAVIEQRKADFDGRFRLGIRAVLELASRGADFGGAFVDQVVDVVVIGHGRNLVTR